MDPATGPLLAVIVAVPAPWGETYPWFRARATPPFDDDQVDEFVTSTVPPLG